MRTQTLAFAMNWAISSFSEKGFREAQQCGSPHSCPAVFQVSLQRAWDLSWSQPGCGGLPTFTEPRPDNHLCLALTGCPHCAEHGASWRRSLILDTEHTNTKIIS